ncbi:hypothetical protein AB1N83_006510 [Pleurotus pulmonarius]
MLLTLPPEILQIIVANVDDRKTLCSLLLTSRQFPLLVEPFLYARIVFPLADRLKGLCEALETSNGRRAAYIRALLFVPILSGDQPIIDKILMTMVNLESLDIYIMITALPIFLYQRPPFALTRFHCMCNCLHPDIFRFLESQTSLETIHLPLASPISDPPPVFSPTSFPRLKNLMAESKVIPAFLRTSARIEHLRVRLGDDINSTSHDWDDASMSSVRTLSCTIAYAGKSLATRFPNLEWLELVDRNSAAFLQRWNPETHKLRGIRMPHSKPDGDPIDFSSVFDAIPTLEFVEHSYKSTTAVKRWYRGDSSPTIVQWLCKLDKEWLVDWEKDVVVPSFVP